MGGLGQVFERVDWDKYLRGWTGTSDLRLQRILHLIYETGKREIHYVWVIGEEAVIRSRPAEDSEAGIIGCTVELSLQSSLAEAIKENDE